MKTAASALLFASLSAVAVAEAPRISNGRVERHPVAGSLEAVARPLVGEASAATWIGWSVPADRARESCCWDSGDDGRCCSGCRLEGRGVTAAGQDGEAPRAARLEPANEMLVLLRAEAGRPTRIRTFAPSCPLDATGVTVHWLEGVAPADSVRFLASFLEDRADPPEARRLVDQALAALAFHAEASAVDTLIDRARRARSPRVRGQALFWLSQRAGDKAVGVIARAVEDDPELDVKKKAVFALSQLPRDEGVPLLIQTARSNKTPAVRKRAFFWLGQSKDQRALAFFEEVLK